MCEKQEKQSLAYADHPNSRNDVWSKREKGGDGFLVVRGRERETTAVSVTGAFLTRMRTIHETFQDVKSDQLWESAGSEKQHSLNYSLGISSETKTDLFCNQSATFKQPTTKVNTILMYSKEHHSVGGVQNTTCATPKEAELAQHWVSSAKVIDAQLKCILIKCIL